jgi:hypothetical protein
MTKITTTVAPMFDDGTNAEPLVTQHDSTEQAVTHLREEITKLTSGAYTAAGREHPGDTDTCTGLDVTIYLS